MGMFDFLDLIDTDMRNTIQSEICQGDNNLSLREYCENLFPRVEEDASSVQKDIRGVCESTVKYLYYHFYGEKWVEGRLRFLFPIYDYGYESKYAKKYWEDADFVQKANQFFTDYVDYVNTVRRRGNSKSHNKRNKSGTDIKNDAYDSISKLRTILEQTNKLVCNTATVSRSWLEGRISFSFECNDKDYICIAEVESSAGNDSLVYEWQIYTNRYSYYKSYYTYFCSKENKLVIRNGYVNGKEEISGRKVDRVGNETRVRCRVLAKGFSGSIESVEFIFGEAIKKKTSRMGLNTNESVEMQKDIPHRLIRKDEERVELKPNHGYTLQSAVYSCQETNHTTESKLSDENNACDREGVTKKIIGESVSTKQSAGTDVASVNTMPLESKKEDGNAISGIKKAAISGPNQDGKTQNTLVRNSKMSRTQSNKDLADDDVNSKGDEVKKNVVKPTLTKQSAGTDVASVNTMPLESKKEDGNAISSIKKAAISGPNQDGKTQNTLVRNSKMSRTQSNKDLVDGNGNSKGDAINKSVAKTASMISAKESTYTTVNKQLASNEDNAYGANTEKSGDRIGWITVVALSFHVIMIPVGALIYDNGGNSTLFLILYCVICAIIPWLTIANNDDVFADGYNQQNKITNGYAYEAPLSCALFLFSPIVVLIGTIVCRIKFQDSYLCLWAILLWFSHFMFFLDLLSFAEEIKGYSFTKPFRKVTSFLIAANFAALALAWVIMF